MESRRIEDIKNLLLKIAIPLAFPLVGSVICNLITNRGNRDIDTDSSYSSIRLDPFYSSSQEEEEEEMNSSRCASRNELVQEEIPISSDRLLGDEGVKQTASAEGLMMARFTENPTEVTVKKVQEDQKMAEEMETLKCMVSVLEERAGAIESHFHDYYDMKEQESTYQKMQIMCLGLKLELLEAQNQRLEAAVAEIRAAAEEFAAMRAKLSVLQNKFKKISKESNRNSHVIDRRMLILDAKEAEMARRSAEFERYMEEMRQLTLQLQKERGANKENVEVIVERSMRKLSSNKHMLDELEALRDWWAADMEEMIYLGWITAWLQNELLSCNDEECDDDDAAPSQARNKGEKLVAAIAASNEVEHCNASSDASPEMHCMESCMDVVAGRKGNGSLARPRLFHKLKGWAKGKGKCKKSCTVAVAGRQI